MYSVELRKEYPTERIAKPLIRLIFVSDPIGSEFLSKAIFLYSRLILFFKKVNGLVPNQDPAYKLKAVFGDTSGSAMTGPFFGQKWF